MYPFRRLKFKIETGWINFRARCQRFMRGWAYKDAWNIDGWFISIMREMLIYFKDNLHSMPYDVSEDEWRAILQEMIDCLNEIEENEEEKFPTNVSSEERREFYTSYIDRKDKSKERFFELFSKWFYSLWD